ncbi:MAG TPA: hypothetical protein VFW33_06830 [Gemmataceae bacterium]|nr:hypothetical protein [Gemmataceae bacterium]
MIIAAWFFCGFLGGLFIALAYLSAFLIAWSRIYYEPFQVFFIFPKPRAQWYPCHPVVWDEVCLLPFPGLDRLLSAYAEHAPEAAAVEIDRLILTYPTQRTAALRAQVRLLARQAAGETDLARLALILTRLPEGEKGFLAQTHRVYELVAEISREQILLSTLERPPLRALRAELLFTKIESFRSKVRGFAEPLASEFRAAAAQWLKVAEHQLNEARARSSREPTPQVFRAGDPVDREQEAFVPRDSVVGELEQQITLSTGCPGLILYGRRRMGKSTALRDLARFPPESVDVALVSMEDPAAFTSLGHFLGRLAEAIRNVRPDAWPESAVPAPGETWDLPAFYRLLGASNERFARLGRRLLLAVEEYEGIDAKIGGGVFPRDLLPMIRESIQSHRRLTWLFAGSHAIGELSCADWPNYLISARTVEVPPFTPSETRLLLTDPLKYSPLYAGNDSGRPRFDAAFWGEGGVERIHAEAGGWPHLVQLIAETVVDLLNQEGARAVTPDLFQRALGKAVQRGDAVLRQLVQRECRLPGEWEYLSTFRRRDTQPPPDDDAIYRSLRRRLLIAEENGDWRLRVPLMQRWLREHV